MHNQFNDTTMSNRQGNLLDFNGNKIVPNTSSVAVLDEAKNQSLSQTLFNTPDKDALGYPAFSTALAYSVGDIVYYTNKLWKFIADKTAGDWDATKVYSALSYCR